MMAGENDETASLSPTSATIAAFAAVMTAAVPGSLATTPNIPGWYAGLAKPALSPPNWVFGPVWTTLYAMMGYAFYRVLRLPSERDGRRAAIAAFLLQLALNAVWSFAFFAAHSPAAGLAVILPMEAAIIATILLFRRLDGVAAGLLVPYALWVAFATLLNAQIWMLNG